jgi:hypothetical protein
LPYPDENEKIVHAIVDLSDRIIVLTKSQEILTSHYGLSNSKNQVIPHGNHIYEAKEKLKNKYELSNKIILSTFGLIENKNIETTLFALKEVVIKHPKLFIS